MSTIHNRATEKICALASLFALVFIFVLGSPGTPLAGRAEEPVAPPDETRLDNPGGQDDLGGLLEGLDIDDVDASPTSPPSTEAEQGDRDSLPGSASNFPADDAIDMRGDPLVRAYFSMRSARDLLRQGQTGDSTQQAQQQAVELLDSLIRQAEAEQSSGATAASSQAEPSADSSSESQQGAEEQTSGARSSDAQGEGGQSQSDQQDARGDGADGGAASDSGEAGGNVTAGVGRGLGARGEGVWGHLPERTRGLLRTEIPTEYLPGYADQISEYFKALAEAPTDE